MQAKTGFQTFETTAGFRQAAPLKRNLGAITPIRRRTTRELSPRYQPRYRPAMLSSAPRKLGALADAPTSLGIGAVGLGAMLLSKILPQPVKTIAQVAGVGLLAVGAITLITPEAEASETEEPTATFPVEDPKAFQQITATILSPSPNQEMRRGLFSGDYDVDILWVNPTDKNLPIPFQVYVEESPVGGEEFRGVAYTGVTSLEPHSSALVPLEIDLKHSGVIEAMATAIRLTVRKVSSSGQKFDVATTQFIVY